MTVEIPTPDPRLTRPVTASRSLPGGSLLVSALAQYSMSADTEYGSVTFSSSISIQTQSPETYVTSAEKVIVPVIKDLLLA
jgi:hypothetical protein